MIKEVFRPVRILFTLWGTGVLGTIVNISDHQHFYDDNLIKQNQKKMLKFMHFWRPAPRKTDFLPNLTPASSMTPVRNADQMITPVIFYVHRGIETGGYYDVSISSKSYKTFRPFLTPCQKNVEKDALKVKV